RHTRCYRDWSSDMCSSDLTPMRANPRSKVGYPRFPGLKFYFKPGNLGYPTFDLGFARIGVFICYDRHFPEGARALGLNGAEIVRSEERRGGKEGSAGRADH